jgi:hypothetical protein
MALHSQLDDLINTMLPVVQQFHAKSQLAPHAACMRTDGTITGSALITNDDRNLSVSEAITHFEAAFREDAQHGRIVASAIFFHGVGLHQPIRPAQTLEEARTLVALLEHAAGESVHLVIPYRVTDKGIEYEMRRLIAKVSAVFRT